MPADEIMADPGHDGPGGPTSLRDQLMDRRMLLAGAAGVGALGIGAAIALNTGGGGVKPIASGTASASATPSPGRTRTTAGGTSTGTTSAATSTTGTTSAATTSTGATTSTSQPPTTSHPPTTTKPPTSTTTPPTSSSPPPTSTSAPPPGDYLVDEADVPVKGGVIFGDGAGEPKVVVTHPAGPDFKCFTSVCTHMGCIVGEVKRNVITCYCHGSQYDAWTGEVVSPPAPDPLAPQQIARQDGKIYLV